MAKYVETGSDNIFSWARIRNGKGVIMQRFEPEVLNVNVVLF